MRFDIHRRFRIDVVRENDGWVAYRIGTGTRAPAPDIAIPARLTAGEIAGFLDDLFHELADHRSEIRRVGQERH